MLRKMMFNGMKESAQREVALPTFGLHAWKNTLDSIYAEDGSVSNASEVLDLLECAMYYQLVELEHRLLEEIVSFLDGSNL